MQSEVAEHSQLAWLIECTASFGELSRMTQFKEKSDRQQFVSAALFTYPALMAADILLYDTDRVPVGDDQRQHLELTRDVAERFNNRYGDTFVVPEADIPKVGARIMDLQDPTQKMSKSIDSPQGTVLMLDEPAVIEKKFKRAVTDNDGEVRYDPSAKPGVSNLLEILAAATDGDPAALATGYAQYGPLKADAAAAVVELLRPVQARYAELMADHHELRSRLDLGAKQRSRHRRVPPSAGPSGPSASGEAGGAGQSSSASLRAVATWAGSVQSAGGRWCSRAQATVSGSLPARAEEVAAQAVVLEVQPDPAHEATLAPPRRGHVVAGDLGRQGRHHPPVGAEPGLDLADVVEQRGGDHGPGGLVAQRPLDPAGHRRRVAAVGAGHPPPQHPLGLEQPGGRPLLLARAGPPGRSDPKKRRVRWLAVATALRRG